MRIVKRILIVVIVLVLAGGGWLVFQFTRPAKLGAGPLDRWMARQLQTTVSRYLAPTLTMESFEFRLPNRFTMRNARLTAADPDSSDGTLDIIEAERITLELAETPRRGEPLRVEKVRLENATVRLVSRSPEDLSLIGFSDLVRPTENTPSPEDEATTRVSDVLQIRRIEMSGLTVVRERRGSGAPMELTGITTSLDVNPREGQWYAFESDLKQGPLFDLKTSGRLDVDEGILELTSFDLSMDVDEDTLHYLPPEVQEIVHEYDIAGAANVHGNLRLAPESQGGFNLTAGVELADGNIAVGDLRFPSKSVKASVGIRDDRLTIQRFEAQTLGGGLSVIGTVGLTSAGRLNLTFDFDKVQLEQTIRALAEDPTLEPEYGGELTGRITWRAPYAHLETESSGDGEFRIRKGRLGRLPLVAEISHAIVGAARAIQVERLVQPSDRASVKVAFEGDRVKFTDWRVDTETIAIRGEGTVAFSGETDGVANGGPLEKAQSILGPVGSLVGGLTDRLAHYRISGHISDPKVELKLGGAPRR